MTAGTFEESGTKAILREKDRWNGKQAKNMWETFMGTNDKDKEHSTLLMVDNGRANGRTTCRMVSDVISQKAS